MLSSRVLNTVLVGEGVHVVGNSSTTKLFFDSLPPKSMTHQSMLQNHLFQNDILKVEQI